MEELILISYLNDFIYCPISIYFHQLYGNTEKILYQESYQIQGTASHKCIDNRTYSTRKSILQGIEVYSSKYNIIGKIDILDIDNQILTERKKKITKLYDGFIFQLYAQYFSLIEMGYQIKKIRLYSSSDNKMYNIDLPEKNITMLEKFENLIIDIKNFKLDDFVQTNSEKCMKCIYEPACDRSKKC